MAAFQPTLLRSNYQGLSAPASELSMREKIGSSPLFTLAYNGQFAVLVFFVLSGYVLSKPAIEGDWRRLQERAWGRYIRLNLPLAAAGLFSWMLLISGYYWTTQASPVTGSIWLARYFTIGMSFYDMLWMAITGIFRGDSDLIPPGWTLQFEFFGSLILLAALLMMPRRWPLLHLTAAAIVVAWLLPLQWLYYVSFFTGAAVNWLPIKRGLLYPFACLGLYFGAYQSDAIGYSFLPNLAADPKTFYNAIGAFLLVASVANGFGSRVLLSRACQFLGRNSYGLYILHFPVLASVTSFLIVKLGNGPAVLAVLLPIYVGICFALAEVFTRLVDEPSIRLSHSISRNILRGPDYRNGPLVDSTAASSHRDVFCVGSSGTLSDGNASLR